MTKLCLLLRDACTHRRRVSLAPAPPDEAPQAAVGPPRRSSPGQREGSQAAGQRLLLSPCVGSASPVGRPQNLLVDVIDTPCLLP